MIDFDDFSDIEKHSCIPPLDYHEPLLKHSKCEDTLLTVMLNLGDEDIDFDAVNVFDNIGLDASMSLLALHKGKILNCKHFLNKIKMYSPHINELLDFLDCTNRDIYYIRKNENLSNDNIMKFIDEGYHSFESTSHSEEVSHRLIKSKVLTKGKVYQDDMDRLEYADISQNPNLTQELYREVIADGGIFDKHFLSENNGMDADTILMYLSDDIGPQQFSNVMKLDNTPDFIKENSGILSLMSKEDIGRFIDKIKGEKVQWDDLHEISLNPHLTEDMIMSLIDHVEPIFAHQKNHPVPGEIMGIVENLSKISQDVGVVERIFHMLMHGDSIEFHEVFLRFRDEADIISTYEASARWAALNSPHLDVVSKCCQKHPDVLNLISKNPFMTPNMIKCVDTIIFVDMCGEMFSDDSE